MTDAFIPSTFTSMPRVRLLPGTDLYPPNHKGVGPTQTWVSILIVAGQTFQSAVPWGQKETGK